MPDLLRLSSAIQEEITAHAREGYPDEVCGLVSGHDGTALHVHRGRNVAPQPSIAFELDSDTLTLQLGFEDDGLELVGIYHSHPKSAAIPSAIDIARFAYPEAVLLICSLLEEQRPQLCGYRIADGVVTPVTLCLLGALS